MDSTPTLFGFLVGFLVGLTGVGAIVTGVAHMTQGNVDFTLAGMLLVGSVPGVLIGSKVAPLLPSRPLKVILSLMLVFVRTQMLMH
jgi:uncharacterized membrane protein YfcA